MAALVMLLSCEQLKKYPNIFTPRSNDNYRYKHAADDVHEPMMSMCKISTAVWLTGTRFKGRKSTAKPKNGQNNEKKTSQ
jgi:hypothetical protein